MRLEPESEEQLRRYVLGSLEEDSRLQLEEKLIQDPDAFELLGVIEDELTEEYLDGTLTGVERLAYERQRSISPDLRRAPEFFSALKARASATATEPQRVSAWDPASWFRPVALQPAWLGAAAAALLLSLAAHVWVAQRAPSPQAFDVVPVAVSGEELSPPPLATPAVPGSSRLAELTAVNRELEGQLDAERQQLAQARTLLQQLESAASTPRSAIPTFTLAAGLLRSGGSLTRVAIPADVDVVRLLLDLPDDEYPLYRAALLDVDGDEIWSQSKLTAESTGEQVMVTLLVPASVLVHGDYQMKVSGITESGELEGLASYTFRALPD